MCQIFVRTDPDLYRSRSRSLRLRGVSTSIRLENMFWQVLEEIGARDGLTLPQLIARLYDELAEAGEAGHEAHANFSSFLRVCCMRHLMLQARGSTPAESTVRLREAGAHTLPAH